MFFKNGLDYQALSLPDRFDWDEEKRLNKSEEFYDWMSRRHSVRDFKKTKVDRRIIENSIRTAGTAPSGANHQPWHFVAICNNEMKVKIRRAAEIEEKDFFFSPQRPQGVLVKPAVLSGKKKKRKVGKKLTNTKGEKRKRT